MDESQTDKKILQFNLFTEVPKFNLLTGSEDLTQTSMRQWEPPCSLEDIGHAVEELNSDNPASIMLETVTHSLAILGGPQRFMCTLSDGNHAYHFISKAKEANTKVDLEIRVGGDFHELPGRYSLSKKEVVILAEEFAVGNGIYTQQLFEVEIKEIDGNQADE